RRRKVLCRSKASRECVLRRRLGTVGRSGCEQIPRQDRLRVRAALKKARQHDQRGGCPAPPLACGRRPEEVKRVAAFRDYSSRWYHPPHSSKPDALCRAASPHEPRPRPCWNSPTLPILMTTLDYVGIVRRLT